MQSGWISVCLLLVPVVCYGNVARKVDAYVRAEMQKRQIPGVSLAVVRAGRPVLIRGYGRANLELDVPATPDTVYQLASITKTFTATAILLLAQEGKLSLEDSVRKFLPDAPAAWEGITVRHLLNHTSGIKSYTELLSFLSGMGRAYTQSEMLKTIYEQPLEFAPGERWKYNNSGYYLLGVIVEKVSGKDYEAFLRERIFQPAGMTATRLNVKSAIIRGRAAGYTRVASEVRHAEMVHPSQPFAAGALLSTARDMARWDAVLYTDRILKLPVLEQMWTPTKLKDGTTHGYGYGWGVRQINGHREIGHGGGIPGFSTYMARFVDDKLSVIVLVNMDGGHAEALARGIAGYYLPDLAPKPVTDGPDSGVASRVRQAIHNFVEGRSNVDLLAPQVRAALTPERTQQAGNFLKSLGALQSMELLEQQVEGDLRRYRYRVRFASGSVICQVALDREDRFVVLLFAPE
ncbi:MAG: serine hydrolase domain-containing protein [Chloroherpetonaceae bacterium]|nr:beta-lactamase family protein [Chthonomonadaceae bacterium]MDW8206318.1 serine hydrolase domain-containing protein [Chloroherpetonaceae bacterium]